MNRGEKVFGANWVEQWRENFRERPFPYCEGMPELDIADQDGCDVFNWEHSPVWAHRQQEIMEEDDDDHHLSFG